MVGRSVDPPLTPDPVGALAALSDTGDRGVFGCGERSFLLFPDNCRSIQQTFHSSHSSRQRTPVLILLTRAVGGVLPLLGEAGESGGRRRDAFLGSLGDSIPYGCKIRRCRRRDTVNVVTD